MWLGPTCPSGSWSGCRCQLSDAFRVCGLWWSAVGSLVSVPRAGSTWLEAGGWRQGRLLELGENVGQCQPQTGGKSKGPPELGQHVSQWGGGAATGKCQVASRLGNSDVQSEKALCPASSRMSLSVGCLTALGGEQKGGGTECPLLAAMLRRNGGCGLYPGHPTLELRALEVTVTSCHVA